MEGVERQKLRRKYWFEKGVAILYVILYSGDVGSDFWVAIDLILRCHYNFATCIFCWIVLPGIIQGWVEFFKLNEGRCSSKNVLKALFFPLLSIPFTLYRLISVVLNVDDAEAIVYAKL